MKKIIFILSIVIVLCFKLFSASSDVVLKLKTNDGSSALHIEDSSGVIVSSITSDGDAYYLNNVDIDGTLDVDSVVTLNNDITVIGDLTISSITSTGSTYFLKDVNITGDLGVSTITSTGNLDITGRILPNGAAGTDGQVLTTYTSSMTWTTLPSDKWEGTPNIYYTGGKVGIGTNNPSEILEINGDITFSGSGGTMYKVDEIEGYNGLELLGSAGGSNDFYIDAGGKVGIGTTTGSHLLTVAGGLDIRGGVLILDNAEKDAFCNWLFNTYTETIDNSGNSGWGFVLLDDAAAYAEFYWDNSGNVTLLLNSANVANSSTPDKLCIYGDTDGISIENRLGSSYVMTYKVTKSQ